MYSLDKEYNLVFKDNSGNEVTIKEDIKDEIKYDELVSFPEGTKLKEDIMEVQFYKIIFPDGSILKVFKDPVNCQFKGYNKEIDLYSYEHLKLILEKLKYNCPFYFSDFYRKKIYIDINKISETNINVDAHIEILDKIDDVNKIKNIFKELESKYTKGEINYDYQFLNPNYNKYYPNSDNLLDKFKYLNSNIRSRILYKVEYFVNNNSHNDISTSINKDDLIIEENDPYLLPICGPHGTGKTVTALYIHKYLFLKGIKGIYLNLKYYSKEDISLEDKIEVLIKECFFIVENENELLELYNKLIRLNKFYPAIFIITDFIEKRISKNNNIYIILDQYQDKYNFTDILKLITKIKIFLLSSINDKDVKTNLIKKYKEEIQIESKKKPKDKNSRDIIKYNYIDNLIDSVYFKRNIYKNIFLNKIKQYEKDEKKVNDELNFIYYILEKFNFIPKYVFRYISYYESILDLLFQEYTNIIKKLNSFVDLGTINIDKLNKLINNNFIAKKKDIQNPKILTKEKFVELLDYIPLKYISFIKKGNDEYYFYYTFPLFKKILEDFTSYISSKSNFFLSDDGGIRGSSFEKIVKMELRGFKKLNINGYFKVNQIIDMNLTKKYKRINENYFKFKDNILIDQKIRDGKDYDFGIYQPKQKNLILIQSKYIINYNTVTNVKSYYKSSAKNALNSFNLITNEKVKNVYLLYISSVDYNYENRKKVMENILSNNNINCLFYSVNYDNFSMDFGNFIKEIQCKDSFMIIPQLNLYEEQIPLDNPNFEIHIQIKEDKIKKDKILLQKKNLKVVNLKELHTQIINFIKNSDFDKKDIIKSLGPFKVMNNYFVFKQFEINKKKEYSLLFYLDKFGNFNADQDLGLIYFEDEKNYFYDFLENKEYNSYDE